MRLPVVVYAVAVVSGACGPRFIVDSWLPAPVEVGLPATVAVEVVAGQGDHSLLALTQDLVGIGTGEVGSNPAIPVASLQDQLPGKLTQSGHFTLAAGGEAELTFRLTVTDFSLTAWDGSASVSGARELRARLNAELQVLQRHDGLSTLPARSYAAQVSHPIEAGGRVDDYRDSMASEAAASLAAQIAYDFVPTQRARNVAIDDGAPEVKAAVELMARDDRAGARAELNRVLAASPDCAAAHYDLGLLDEGDSQFPAAEARYRRAIALGSRRLYVDALNRVEGLRASAGPGRSR